MLGYGGQAGGGKTDLILGLAGTAHRRSAIFRRVFPNLKGIIDRSKEIFAPPTGTTYGTYHEGHHRWKLDDGRLIELESMQYDSDKQKQRGRPRDLIAFDEATEFSENMVRFVMAWGRTTTPGQRVRTVLTFNPPTDEAGEWIIEYFRPWLAYLHPNVFDHDNPAEPGELRWYATIDGKDVEVGGPEPVEHEGETITPTSRTFIPAELSDNPYLEETGYRRQLQALPEPLRSQLLEGDFTAGAVSNPWQVIPTEWVKLAQRRWLETNESDVPVSAVGLDVVRGGGDRLALVKRRGRYFDEILTIPGIDIEDGPRAAQVVVDALANEPHVGTINVDVIGVGSSAYDSLKAIFPGRVAPVNAAHGSDYVVERTDDKGNVMTILKMRNRRAEYHWRLREALDPVNGDDLALPPGNDLVTELCAARWKLMAGGVVQIEPKETIKKRIGRSPDLGEAVMLANYYEEPPVGWDDVEGLGKVENYQSKWT